MTTIRIWAVESDYDAKAVECLATKLAKHLQLVQSIYPSVRQSKL